MLSMRFNPFTWDSTSERVRSNILTLELRDDKQRAIRVSQSSEIFMKIPLKTTGTNVEQPLANIFIKNTRFHEINVDYENTSIQLEITPADAAVNLMIFIRFNYRSTILEHDANGTVSSNGWCIWRRVQGNIEWERVCSSNRKTPIQLFAQKRGKYYVEIETEESRAKRRQKRSCFEQRRQKRSCVEVKPPPPPSPKGENVTVVPKYDPATDHNYTMRTALASCVYWSEEQQMWTTEGCQVRVKPANCWHTLTLSLLMDQSPKQKNLRIKILICSISAGDITLIIPLSFTLPQLRRYSPTTCSRLALKLSRQKLFMFFLVP